MYTLSQARVEPRQATRARLHYRLECLERHTLLEDSEKGFILANPEASGPALLRAVYDDRSFTVRPEEPGLFRYRSWLPVRRSLVGAGAPVAFHAEALGRHLGMKSLTVVFSGYWSERGAALETCSFKELESLAVLARVPEEEQRTLVVASAGNTGRAFMQTACRYGLKVAVVVPERALGAIWSTVPSCPEARLVVLTGDSDYFDAIALADLIATLPGFYPEGGAKNVARRDGMGTTLLAAAEQLGDVPAHYVQAVGSGTGGIAAWEMSSRLFACGWGSRPTRLHLVQNAPFTPMTDAWNAGSRVLAPMDHADALQRIEALHSPVLSNRKPPYAIAGGVFDALSDTGGFMYGVSTPEAVAAGELFERLEGCDLDPAAAVALAGLIRGVENGSIPRGDTVALNLTGGGRKGVERDLATRVACPDVVFAPDEVNPAAVARKLG